MSADYLKRELISHTRKVCSLYKKMSRDIDFWEDDFLEGRFRKLVLRAEFDKYKNIKDMREGKRILEMGEKKHFDLSHPIHVHGQPLHAYSKEGIAYGRNLESPDYVMDHYHPLEKAQYPYYYAKREEMKDEYIKLWKKKMMKPGEDEQPDRS